VSIAVRQLLAADAAAFRDIRLEMLQINPEAFGSTYEAESGTSVDEFANWLGRSFVAGGFIGHQLAGVAAFYPLQGPKVSHRGNIWGVYVRSAFRGRGVGHAVLSEVLRHAGTLVEQVHLQVVAENAAAYALYERLGFTRYGTEPRALRVGDRYYDEHLMALRL
jgi:ribosomal protein S18 acetylase RimI-like enzyme